MSAGQPTIYQVGGIVSPKPTTSPNSKGYPPSFQQTLLNYVPPPPPTAAPPTTTSSDPKVEIVTAAPTFPPTAAFIPNAGMGGGYLPFAHAFPNTGMYPMMTITPGVPQQTEQSAAIGGPYPIGNSYVVPHKPDAAAAASSTSTILGTTTLPVVKKTPSKWTITLLSGYGIPRPGTENEGGIPLSNPNVKITLHDLKSKEGSTPTVYVSGEPKKWMGKNPVWNDERGFIIEKITTPSAASLLFSIWDFEISSGEETFMAAASIPLSSMVKGKHNVPLFNQENFNQTGQSFSTLYIDVDIVD